MSATTKSLGSAAAALLLTLTFATTFTGSVLGVEGRLPTRLMPEAVTLAVTSSVSVLPAAHAHR